MKRRRKVIGFDSWLGGVRSYQLLIPPLKKRSIDLTLVHISSWGNDVSCPEESTVGSLNCRDIRFYGGDNFERILDIEKPDVVILTSTDTFAHRAIIRYCLQRSIPTLNLYHGIRSVIDTADELGSPKIPLLSYIKVVSSKCLKLIMHTFPVYIKALWKTKASGKDWIRFFTDVLYFSVGRDPAFVKASGDSKTTKCAVYVESDVQHAMSCYGIEKGNIEVVGNPDFYAFGMQQSLIKSWSEPSCSDNKSVMYLETGFSSCGFYFSSTKEFIDHLISTSINLKAQGFKMLLKLKPGQLNEKEILKGLSKSTIEIIDKKNFLEKLKNCHGCITERTSLAVLPALLGMPLVLAKYGPLQPVAYGAVLKSYPQISELYDISTFSTALDQLKKDFNEKEVQEWINSNAGPIPFEAMPDRVASLIENMMA